MGKNSATIVGGLLTATGAGAPIGLGLIAADQAEGGELFPGSPEDPNFPKEDGEGDLAAANAAEAERRRKKQTDTKRSGSVSEALAAATGATKLGGTS
ncbi:MAG: hypothetical protein ACR2QM_12610 [Longimicrobiales bacterium]